MTPQERKQLQAQWRKLAKIIGPGRKPAAEETTRRWHEVMDARKVAS